MPIESAAYRQKKVIIILVLIVLILAVYWQVQNFEFISYDDQLYVTHNFKTQTGMTLKSIGGAFTDLRTTNWHPLTMISHMLDWRLFGEMAGGHHWTSVIIHIFNTVLLFLLLNQLTGAIWRSAFVAALFAVHPINVESVAWVAERKNVLSTFFWILTVLFYVRYVKQPGWKRYLPVFVCFALGLMSKPMLVTLPFVLLLLDYWPLNRTAINTQNDDKTEIGAPQKLGKVKLSLLIWEKIPLFILTAISIYLTVYAAKGTGTIVRFNLVPLLQRLYNAILSYVLYLKKLFWPVDLAVFYPLRDISTQQVLPAFILLILITVVCCKYYKKYPFLIVGWFYYLGTLVPVIGIVQVGSQAMADRYAYIPFMGIFIALSWMVTDIIRTRLLRIIASILLAMLLIVLSVAAYKQVACWKDSHTLFERALHVTKDNFVAHVIIGNELIRQNKIDEAIRHFQKAISGIPKNPADYDAFVSFGNALSLKGKKTEAIAAFKQALNINPKGNEAYYRLGFVYFQTGRVDEAIAEYQKAIALDYEDPLYHGSLGNAFFTQGKNEEAIREYKEVLLIQPDNIDAHNNLAIVLVNLGRLDEAVKYLREATRLRQEYAIVHNKSSRDIRK